MSAWGEGPFENDDASDFANDLAELTDSSLVVAVLGDALLAVTAETGYIEASEMSRAVGAACVVALFADPNLPTPQPLERRWLDLVRVPPTARLRNEAAQVMTRALDPADNEWHELWSDADLLDDVRTSLEPYASVLRAG